MSSLFKVFLLLSLLFFQTALALDTKKYCPGLDLMAKDFANTPAARRELLSKSKGVEYDFGSKRVASFERARNLLMNAPVLKELGIDFNNVNARRPYVCRSKVVPELNGKICGYEFTTADGRWARLRLDNDTNPANPNPRRAHFNLEFESTKGQTHKIALGFDCHLPCEPPQICTRPCTSAEVGRFAAQLSH